MNRSAGMLACFSLLASLSTATAQTRSPFVPLTTLFPADASVDEYGVTRDGNRVYYSTVKGEVWLFDRRQKTSTKISEGGSIWDVTVAANGSAVAYTKSGENNKDEFVWIVPLDPATGHAAGPQRRVSMIPGDVPSIAPDGRQLAFARDDDSTGKQSLVIVPMPGGPERVISSFAAPIGMIRWTPDAKSVYVTLNPPRADRTIPGSIQRIPVAGGPPKLIAYAAASWPGLSPTGEFIAFIDTGFTNLHVVVDTNGRRLGSFVPPPAMGGDLWLDDHTIVASRSRNPLRLHAYNVADGSSRVVMDTTDRVFEPAWSPDGKRIAFAMAYGYRSGLAVTNADGSAAARIIPLQQAFSRGLAWSPDGKWLFYENGGALHSPFIAVEIATGRQIELPGTGQGTITVWSADSRHVLVSSAAGTSASAPAIVVRELDLAGGSRTIREIPVTAAARHVAVPVNGNSLLVMRDPDSPIMLESLTGSSAPIQVAPAPHSFVAVPTLSSDGKWVALRRNTQSADNTKMNVIDVAALDGSNHKTINLPFFAAPGGNLHFLPGNRQLVVAENSRGNKEPGVYMVTVATGEAKRLFTIRLGTRLPDISLSPDGKTLLYVNRDSLPPSYAALDVRRVVPAKR